MMHKSIEPNIVASKCLGFNSCRFNGLTVSSAFVESLKGHVNYITVCPEMEIGLGVPRDPVRIVEDNARKRLIQSKSNVDLTDKITEFSDNFLGALPEIDGFILKSSSPSCGINITRIYSSMKKGSAIGKGDGFFGAAVREHFPGIALEDEGRLNNFSIREHFLTRIFISAKFRALRVNRSMHQLIQFHSNHKYLFMSLNQMRSKNLGRILANHGKLTFEEVFTRYGTELTQLLTNTPKSSTRVNALHHVMGHFSKEISSREKGYILDNIEQYREGKIPFGVPLGILRSYAIRNKNSYIEDQTFFEPYPVELMDIGDSGKGRLRK